MTRLARNLKKLGIRLLSLLLILCMPLSVYAATEIVKEEAVVKLKGSGSQNDPYLIQNYDDLRIFRDYVNNGNTFEGCFVYQTDNIDMLNSPWRPIGVEDSPFLGVYDGGGHYVENLFVPYRGGVENNYNGFFSMFGGTVANFGIKSGFIEGDYCGAIVSQAVEDGAMILNCYSMAKVSGIRAGGVADNFKGGTIATSWHDGELNATDSDYSALLSSGGNVKVYHAYAARNSIVATRDIFLPNSVDFLQDFIHSEEMLRKLNLSTALTQYLFANGKGINLVQWKLGEDGLMSFGEGKEYIEFFGWINYYLLPFVLLLIMLGYAIAFARAGKGAIWEKYKTDITAIGIISGIVALFMHTALVLKGREYLNTGNSLFIFLVDVMFVSTIFIAIKYIKRPIRLWNKEWIPIICVIAFVSVLELTQFDVVPKFDASIYYGSLLEAEELFRLDFLTYIGAFVCWKWIHGLILLIGPFEFLFPGQMFGIYIANMIINGVTMACFYWLIRQIVPKTTPLVAALGSLILILCPYQLGLFAYLCMDAHTALFIVWLLCSYRKKSPILVAFCGYLLAFNKITGLVFYVFFLLTMGVIEMMNAEGENFWRKIWNWWNWKTVLLWIFPAVVYLFTMVRGEELTIQNFYGAYREATYGLKHPQGLANTFLQSSVYGFRWIFLFVAIVFFVYVLIRWKNVFHEVPDILIGTTAASLSVFMILCLYRGDAECPRYTALFNTQCVLVFMIAIHLLTDRVKLRSVLTIGMSMLLLTQLFWTIDPSILLTSESIDTGKKKIYKLALPGDDRIGMKLGTDYGLGFEVMGDLYTYNFEHNFYDDLLDKVFAEIQPDEDTQLILLDIIGYELHIYGNKYPMYWNSRMNHRTYDSKDPDSVFLGNQRDVTTELICDEAFEFDDQFYLLVPDRVDSRKAIDAIVEQGYILNYELHPENMYGKLHVYGFELQ